MERNETVYDPFMDDCPVELTEESATNRLLADAQPDEPITEEEARRALREYEELEDTIREFEDERQWVVEKLQAWLERQEQQTARLEGREKARTITMVQVSEGLRVS